MGSTTKKLYSDREKTQKTAELQLPDLVKPTSKLTNWETPYGENSSRVVINFSNIGSCRNWEMFLKQSMPIQKPWKILQLELLVEPLVYTLF